jgi:hypothetical protein
LWDYDGFQLFHLFAILLKLPKFFTSEGAARSPQVLEAQWQYHSFRNPLGEGRMNPLTIFGLVAVTAMLVSYALEKRSHWFVLAFGVSCALGSAYGFLQGAWPFGIVEAIWAVVAVQRWRTAASATTATPSLDARSGS